MDLELLAETVDRAKKRGVRESIDQDRIALEQRNEYLANWSRFIGVWTEIVRSAELADADETRMGAEDVEHSEMQSAPASSEENIVQPIELLSDALERLVNALRDHGKLGALEACVKQYEPRYCDGTDHEAEARAVGILISALQTIVGGQSASEVATIILKQSPVPDLQEADSARFLLEVIDCWPTKCANCGIELPPRHFQSMCCESCSGSSDDMLVTLVSYIEQYELGLGEQLVAPDEVFSHWSQWRTALQHAFPGVVSDTKLCERFVEYLQTRQSLPYLGWQSIPLTQVPKLLPPCKYTKEKRIEKLRKKSPLELHGVESLGDLEAITPQFDLESMDWIRSAKENWKKLESEVGDLLRTNSLAKSRTEAMGGKKIDAYFGVDAEGRRWRRDPDATPRSGVYYYLPDLKTIPEKG